MNKEETITKEELGQQYNDYWNYMIKNDIIYGNIQTIDNQQLKDLSIIKHDHNGKVKFKKHDKSKNNAIKIGDQVKNGDDYGEVVDIDGDLLCVRIDGDEIRVWNTDDVKRLR